MWRSLIHLDLSFVQGDKYESIRILSYTRSRDRPGKTQQTGIFCGKALLLTSSGAREQESKSSIAYIFRSQSARALECKSQSKSARAKAREQECKRARALLLTSLGARAQECKSKSLIAYIVRSKKQEPEQESKREGKSARAQELYCLHLQEQEAREQELYCLNL